MIMSIKSSIYIALQGFDSQDEEGELTVLFGYTKHLDESWIIVADIQQADFILVAANHPDDIKKYSDTFKREQLIAYSPEPLETAHYHLLRTRNNPPSPISLTLLLKKISREQPLHKVTPKVPDKEHKFSCFKVLIVGSVGAGKTTLIETLSQGNCIGTDVAPSDHTGLYKKATTVAMDYAKIQLDNRTVHLYGAPGQRRFDFMSDILIKDAKALVILVNNTDQKPLSELSYYLNTHEKFLRLHPIVIGVTHNDLNPRPSLREYQQFLTEYGKLHSVVKIDVRCFDEVLALVVQLLEEHDSTFLSQ
jgi:uncharacterized protein